MGRAPSSASFRSGPEPREWHYGQRHMKGRTYRSDTWPHQPATAERSKNPLPTESRPYTAQYCLSAMRPMSAVEAKFKWAPKQMV